MKEESPTYTISAMPEEERPRERLVEFGAERLSPAELLAILLRTGIRGKNAVQLGHDLLDRFGGLHGIHQASFTEVCDQKGVGLAKAAQIKAAIELGRRLSVEDPDVRKAINSPSDAAEIVKYEMSALEQEELRVLLLNTRNQVIRKTMVYRGSVNSSQARVAEVFKDAIRNNAKAIIVVHNHPSGDPTPSPDDIAITRAFVQAGELLDIQVLDHLIIGRGRYESLKEKGLGFG
jgi:DNA repair protein RadC